jgi:hypothetical protein
LFLKALRPEWKATCTMIRVHEHVDEYSLTDMYDLLKNHEAELGLNNDSIGISVTGGQLAFVAQGDKRTANPSMDETTEDITLSEVESGGDQCFIVNGKKMYGKKPTKTYT